MAEVDLERLVLPALLAPLVLGAFMVVVTSGGAEEPLAPLPVAPVKPGDTAQSIASAAAVSVDGLADLNPSIDPDSLRVGQTLKLVR